MTGPTPQDPAATVPGRPSHDPAHRDWLRHEARRLIDFFRPSLRPDGGFSVLDLDGRPLPGTLQELHTTTRMVHAFALAGALGEGGTAPVIDAGMAALARRHRDGAHGGYFWSFDAAGPVDTTKLAYGHVFVLLAGASARQAGHPGADALITDARAVLERHFWDEDAGLLRDEFTRDWQPFSTYRGMNANMHGVEALLASFEATGNAVDLGRAGRILDFFTARMAPAHDWHIPEHYTEDWRVDPGYSGNPMFRPAGTTPGHSLELGRLVLQHWDLAGRPASGPLADAPLRARRLIETALAAGWDRRLGGIVYTLNAAHEVSVPDRYWWPVAEAIGAVAALQKADPQPQDEIWYARLWDFARAHLIDAARGGWFPEIDAAGRPTDRQFKGKPDIYHALQALLLPLAPGLSRLMEELPGSGRPG